MKIVDVHICHEPAHDFITFEVDATDEEYEQIEAFLSHDFSIDDHDIQEDEHVVI